MKRLIFLSIFFLFLFPAFVSAHPGKTAADGCHVCRSNCAKWSVAKGVKHCHSGESEPALVSEIKIETRNKTNIPSEIKALGWEYGLNIQKIKGNKSSTKLLDRHQ